MAYNSDFRRNVRYELMLGREATEAIASFPVGYLPIGCLERHGDHLPMGLDAIKAHQICCLAAQMIGGVVFPPHFYAGIHQMTPEQIRKYTGQWGNVYTDATAEPGIVDVIRQLAIVGLRVLVLYTGTTPSASAIWCSESRTGSTPRAGSASFRSGNRWSCRRSRRINETSLMLYLDRALVDMSRIAEVNFRDHGWTEATSPRLASIAKAEADVATIVEYLRGRILPLVDTATG